MSMNDNTIIRTVKKSQYVTINNSVFTDSRLSWKAKGIMGYLLSRPDNWKVIIGDLVKQSKDGRDAVYSGLKELKKYGYLEQRPIRNEEGKKAIIRWEYRVYEEPIYAGKEPLPENPEVDQKSMDYLLPDFPYVDNPDVDNPTLQSTDSSNDGYNQLSIKQQQETPTESGEVQNPVVVGMDISKGLEQIGVKVSAKELKNWLREHGEKYVLKKIAVVRGMIDAGEEVTTPLKTLRAAIKGTLKEEWYNSSANEVKTQNKGISERQGRVVPAVQPGKYERFYQVYGKTGQNKAQ